MYPEPRANVERWRVKKGPMGSTKEYGNNGVFVIPYSRGVKMRVIVSDGEGWEHVSCSPVDSEGNSLERVATWQEMCWLKELFWQDDEVVVQYHPAKKSYVNCHPYVLHLWRPTGEEIPTPPGWMVGPKGGRLIGVVDAPDGRIAVFEEN